MTKKRDKRIETFGFDDTIWVMIGIPVVSFLIPLLFFEATLSNGFIAYLPKWIVSLVYTCAYWFSARRVFAYFRTRYPAYKDTRKRLIYSILGLLVTFIFWNIVLDIGHRYGGGFGHDDNMKESAYTTASLTILLLVSSVYESIFFNYRWKQSIIETETLRSENVQSQLEGLKNQVNPHFLFNSLNTLTYLIPENPEKAVKFVQKLSTVYRYILEIRDKKLIPVEEELEFLYSYIFLLKERFDENIRIDLTIPEGLKRYHIVPLSLQILFENAIKHNIISSRRPLHIAVFTEGEDRLIVRNNLQKKRQTIASTKLGLQNIKNRYAYFSDQKVDVIETAEFFLVSLPLIQVPTKAI